MRKTILAAVAAVTACQANAQFFEDLAQPKPKQKFGEITFTGGNLAASRKTGEMTATGNITAKSGPYRFFTERLTRDVVGTYDFGEDAVYEVTCPKCGEVHQFSEKELLEGSKPCSKCGELLEFEFDEDDSEEMPF